MALHHRGEEKMALHHRGEERMALHHRGEERMALHHRGGERMALHHRGEERTVLHHRGEQRTTLHHRGNQSRIEESSYKSLWQKHCHCAFTYPAVIGFQTIHSKRTLQLSTTSSFCKNCEVLAIQ